MSAYCTVDQVKQRETGDVPTESNAWDGVIESLIEERSDLIDQEVRQLRGQGEGWTFLPGSPVTRRYTGTGAPLMFIDDAVEVTSVQLLSAQGSLLQTLALNIDYLPQPLNTLPITGLVLTHGVWPRYPGGVSIGLTPGYGMTVPPNVTDACIEEVIRGRRAGMAGVDDRLGMSPYGSVIVSKALLQSTVRMLQRYRFGAAMLRGTV
jgi:hypothetical protein